MKSFWLSVLILFSSVQVSAQSRPVSDIKARTYKVAVIKKSRSLRIYLMEMRQDTIPKRGKIILVKREIDTEPVMAFRIMRLYNQGTKFSAKRVRKYPGYNSLKNNEEYVAIEKLRNMNLGLATSDEEEADDRRDMGELEKGLSLTDNQENENFRLPLPDTDAYDEELDKGTSPPPRGEEPKDNDEELERVYADEVKPNDPDRHGLSVEAGFLTNSSRSFLGAGVRYGLTAVHLIFFNGKKAQDSLTLEVGVFGYQVLNLVGINDAWTIYPVFLTARYNLMLSEDFGFFVYGGALQNNVSAGANTSTSEINSQFTSADAATNQDKVNKAYTSLKTPLPAAGLGMLFRLGPRWFMRIDAGVDIIGTGLMLRF